MIRDLAVTLAGGGDCLADPQALRDQAAIERAWALGARPKTGR